MTGSNIPWRLYEFSSLEELLSATGTVAVVPQEVVEEVLCRYHLARLRFLFAIVRLQAGLGKMNDVRGSFDRSMVVVPVKNPKTEHLQRLISKQRPSTVTRLGGVVPNATQWAKEVRSISSID